MSVDTDDMVLDGEAELSATERRTLRRLILDDERATWARRRLRVLIPAVVAMVIAIYQFADWVLKHVKVTP